MVPHSCQLHQILQVIVSQDLPAARILATVDHLSKLFS